MSTREQFIRSVTKALGRSTVEKPQGMSYRHSVHREVLQELNPEQLARVFIDYSKTIGVDVFETTKSELGLTIIQAVNTCSSGDIVIADDPLLNEIEATRLFKEANARVWDIGGTWEDNVDFAEKATVGIAVAKMALAESATVLLFSHGGSGRSVTLLPESTIYIIPKSVIKPRLTQGMDCVRDHKDELPSSVNFVSGPSATSDIELVRVVGVHGPVHVVHLVVHDL